MVNQLLQNLIITIFIQFHMLDYLVIKLWSLKLQVFFQIGQISLHNRLWAVDSSHLTVTNIGFKQFYCGFLLCLKL